MNQLNRRGFFQLIGAATVVGATSRANASGPVRVLDGSKILRNSFSTTRTPDSAWCEYDTFDSPPNVGERVAISIPGIGVVFAGCVSEVVTSTTDYAHPYRLLHRVRAEAPGVRGSIAQNRFYRDLL